LLNYSITEIKGCSVKLSAVSAKCDIQHTSIETNTEITQLISRKHNKKYLIHVSRYIMTSDSYNKIDE